MKNAAKLKFFPYICRTFPQELKDTNYFIDIFHEFMALNTNKNLKQYFSIHEVAEQFGVAESLLRYWEQQFPLLKPHKAGRNVRQYSKEDIETIKVIYNLVKVRGMKIAAAREMLKKNKNGEQSTASAIEKLKEIRQQLVELRSALNTLYPEAMEE